MISTDYQLITTPDELRSAADELRQHAVLGFDCETTDLDPYRGRLRLVQLAAPDGVRIIDLDRFGDGDLKNSEALRPLRDLLAAARPIKIAHNCLTGDMQVSLADGTKALLEELVRNKTRAKVWCLDEQTGQLVVGEVIDWIDAGISPWDNWLRIRTRGKGRLRVTKDHEILTERGRVCAADLQVGDKILTNLPELSRQQREMLYGSLLGDGSVTMQETALCRTPHFKVSHSAAQQPYLALKAAVLGDLVKSVKVEKISFRGFSESEQGTRLTRLTTKSDVRLFELYDNCLVAGKRAITPAWLENLTLPAIAIWYCDDGTLSGGSSASICVSALGSAGADSLAEFLRGKGFPVKLWVRNDGQLYLKIIGPRGRGMSEGLKLFWESLAPYVPVSMQYKLPAAYRHQASDEYWLTPNAQAKVFSDTVVEVLPLLRGSDSRGRYEEYSRGQSRGVKQYCLTVSPHRNFIAGGLAVSNCKFDSKWVKHTLGVEVGGLFDTLLASQLVSAGDMDERHGLEAVAARHLNETIDKAERLSDWSGELSEAQLEYAARDAAVLPPLREKLIEKLKADALLRCAQLEFECVLPVASLELAGIYLDKERWREQLAVVEKKRATLAEELQSMLAEESAQGSLFGGPTRLDINLDSHVQLTRALKRIGITDLPDSTRNWKLQPLAEKYPEIKKLLEYRTVQKALTSYGENILEEINPVTGRIHANFHQIGAPTGRMACTGPNIQQVPHSIEYRRCFRAPEGRKLCIADYSQIELRILADFTGDQGFVDAFNSGADLHRVTASQVFNTPLDQVTKEQRDFAKRLNFGVVYGIGAQRFSMMTGLSLTDAEDILRRYFATYRQLDAWLRDAAQRAVRERTARTASGRLARFRFDSEDRQAISLAQRNGKNTPVQGCVCYDSKIFTESDGYIEIGKLNGKAVRVWDGSRFVNAQVAHSGKKQKVKVEFWGGYYTECSPEHKFLTIDVNGRTSWRTPAQFVKGNYVVLTEAVGEWSLGLSLPELHVGKAHNSSHASLTDGLSDPFEFGVWLGRLASDGSLQDRQLYLLVAQHEEIILPRMRRFTERFGHVSYAVKHGGRGTKPIHFLTVSALGLARQLTEAGLKTRVPDFAWQDSRILAGYLRGMFDGDGTVNQDGAILTFGKGPDFYLDWAREVQQALLLFGVRSRIHRCADRINVCVLKRDMPLFCERIGFLNPQKQVKAMAIKDGTGYENKIYGRAVRIKSVEFTDELVEMYDVVDSETSQFMVNGLVTHNSSADILKRALRLLHDKLRDTSACIVNIVHDEIVVEADAGETEAIAKKVEDAMCAAGEEYVKKVPVKVETEVADEWVK
jgi:DNA polymerase-1